MNGIWIDSFYLFVYRIKETTYGSYYGVFKKLVLTKHVQTNTALYHAAFIYAPSKKFQNTAWPFEKVRPYLALKYGACKLTIDPIR